MWVYYSFIFNFKSGFISGVAILSNAPERLPEKRRSEKLSEKDKLKPEKISDKDTHRRSEKDKDKRMFNNSMLHRNSNDRQVYLTLSDITNLIIYYIKYYIGDIFTLFVLPI